MWAAVGAADLIGPYNATCGPDVFPIAEATRLQNLFVVAFFRRHLFDEADYDRRALNGASLGMRLASLRGDETLSLSNLHAELVELLSVPATSRGEAQINELAGVLELGWTRDDSGVEAEP